MSYDLQVNVILLNIFAFLLFVVAMLDYKRGKE